jgi:ApbE superfamily uncharacterized protein (UPF0280 family)
VSAVSRLLPDGRRLHLQHGPIDLVIEAWGDASEVASAYDQACAAFGTVLPELCAELGVLRAPVGTAPFAGPVAERMRRACLPHAARGFITPMAAVAGAVADHVLARMIDGRRLERAYVNDGGDIAFHLEPGTRLACGLIADVAHPALDGGFVLDHALPARGIATSGRATKGDGGRSFSLGIADAVTVLAVDAAAADAAATVIANAVDLPGHPGIRRVPAATLDPDSDLGGIPVTIGLGELEPGEIRAALARGHAVAEDLRRAGRIVAAVLVLRGAFATAGLDAGRLAA